MKYNRISRKFWTDEKVLKWNNETRLLALYLLTCPHKTTEGLFRLPKQYICADLGWSLEGLAKPFTKLLDDGFIMYDEEVNVILLIRALKYQSPDNPNQEKAAISLLKELPETELLYEFIRQAERFNERFYKRLVEQFAKPLTLSLALSLTPTLTQNNKKNIRLDSEKKTALIARKKESRKEKKSNQNQVTKSNNSSPSTETRKEEKLNQAQLLDSNQQHKEEKTNQKQIDSSDKTITSEEKNTTSRKEKKTTAEERKKNIKADMKDRNTAGDKNISSDKMTQKRSDKNPIIMEFDQNSMPYKTCCFLIDRIVDNNPRSRVPNKDPTDKLMQKWCKELERLNRLGPLGAKESENKGYSWKEIWQLINWCQQEQFWKTNILSAATLRKQAIKLENQIKQSSARKGSKKMDLLKEIYLEAQQEDERGGVDPL